VSAARGRIAPVGASAPRATDEVVDLGDLALLPGLVNAHTHLELSWLRDRAPATPSLPDWVRWVIARRDDADAYGVAALDRAIAEAWAAGTSAVGDIANTLRSAASLERSPLRAVVFHELLGFKPADPEAAVRNAEAAARQAEGVRVRTSLAAHAPYSTSPSVFTAIAASARRQAPRRPISVHLGESPEEREFLETGRGAWRELLVERGLWDPAWTPPGCGPVDYLDRLGFLDDRTVAVHGTHLTAEELRRLRERGASLVACPRSNRRTGVGAPPISAFFDAGLQVAIGSDSLASAPDLDLFAELAEVRRLAPHVPAARLLASATRDGAAILGFDGTLGVLQPGAAASLTAVDVPAGEDDVEEYLVNGGASLRVHRPDASPRRPAGELESGERG
jgi:cytosine/adenosine deaminase-related metal-dependent hydrolase